MGDVGLLTFVEDVTGIGSDEPVRQLQVVVNGPLDLRTCELLRGPGNDFNPPIGSRILVTDIGHGWKLGQVLSDGIDPESVSGEYILYSTDPAGATKMARLRLGVDGKIEIAACPAGVDTGIISIDPLTGQVDINGNFTVDV